MEKIDFTKKCQEIIKKCKLSITDLAQIERFSGAKNPEELYYELENLLEKNIIKTK